METWALLGAYVLGFALVQVLLYRYFVNRGSSSESKGATAGVSNASAPMEGAPESDHGGPPAADLAGDRMIPEEHGGSGGRSAADVVQCGECGAYNRQEQMFVYCRECGERL